MKEDSHYWVKYLGKWTTTEYTGGAFWVPGYSESRSKDEFDALGPEIKIPKRLQKEMKQ